MSKVLGLVLELNPFHNGHLYFINEAKKQIKPDLTIAVLSGSFTMRGDVSVIDKFTKAKLALESGIDIILELPFLAAVNSADYFGYNAIKILTSFNITDLAFGVELDNLEKLHQMKSVIDSEEFQIKIKEYLDNGLSYSTSCYKAIASILNDQEIIENFTLPNNTLGIQYLRGLDLLKKNVNITLIKRISNNYYDVNTTGVISSATSIRGLLENNKNVFDFIPKFQTKINFIDINQSQEKILNLLKYQFISHNLDYFQNILGVSEGIENRISNIINNTNTYDEFIKNVQTKRYTVNKIKRLILHIILNTSKTYEGKYMNYLRLLGANEIGLNYINELPKNIKKELITNFKNKLDDEIVKKELEATKIYGLITKNPNLYLEEFKIPIIGGKN